MISPSFFLKIPILFIYVGLFFGMGQVVQAETVLLDDFATWRFGNGGDIERLFDVYNGAVGDAGPSQVALGVFDNVFRVTVPANNVWYVDQDDSPYTMANQWMKGHIKSGTWDPDINRMVFLVRSTLSSGFDASGSNNMNVGTYVKPLDNFSPGAEGTSPQNGHHYYHGYTTPVTANKWMKVYVTNRNQHERGDPGSVDGAVVPNYFHTMTRFYVTHWGTYPGNPSSTWDLGPIYLYKETGEPDDDISSETIQYNGTKYQVTWAGRKNVDVTYEIRYRLDGVSLKTAGFTSGINGGTVINPGNDYTGVYWELTAPESTNGLYVGIRVSGASQFTELFLPYQVSPTNMGLPLGSDTTPPAAPTGLGVE